MAQNGGHHGKQIDTNAEINMLWPARAQQIHLHHSSSTCDSNIRKRGPKDCKSQNSTKSTVKQSVLEMALKLDWISGSVSGHRYMEREFHGSYSWNYRLMTAGRGKSALRDEPFIGCPIQWFPLKSYTYHQQKHSVYICIVLVYIYII